MRLLTVLLEVREGTDFTFAREQEALAASIGTLGPGARVLYSRRRVIAEDEPSVYVEFGSERLRDWRRRVTAQATEEAAERIILAVPVAYGTLRSTLATLRAFLGENERWRALVPVALGIEEADRPTQAYPAALVWREGGDLDCLIKELLAALPPDLRAEADTPYA